MIGRLFLFFTLVPVVEIVLLAWIASRTSFLFVFGLVIGTGILGVWLARRQGLSTLGRISREVEQGRMPAESLVDGMLVFLAAVLLVIPGLLTDVAAVALLFPPTRRFLKDLARRRLQSGLVTLHYANFGSGGGFGTGTGPRHDEIIDVQVVESPPRELPR